MISFSIINPTALTSMRLLHVHIPGIVPYARGTSIQDKLVHRFLDYKKATSFDQAPPTPTVLTCSFTPTYTCGRREVGCISPAQQEYLRTDGRAEFIEALRGGQTTFHGPGQLVAYLISDLRRHSVSPRQYVRLLESSVISTCAHYGIASQTTDNPGVWTSPTKKIAAVGVHLQRNITSHGIALNVSTDLWWFDRIVACGLEGKETTSFEREGVKGRPVEEVADSFVGKLAENLGGIEGIDRVNENTI